MLKAEKDQWLRGLKKAKPRVNFYGLHYYEICSDAYTQAEELRAKLNKVYERMPRSRKSYALLLDNIRKQESITIAFAAMCLEACIWDYAACQTSNSYTENHLEKLDFVSKWVIIPKLLCGSDITKVRIDGTCFLDRLRKLAKARNTLVHPKSKPLPGNFKDAMKALTPKGRQIAAEDAFGLIKPLLGKLEKVDKTNCWFFKSDGYRNVIKKSKIK